MSDFRDRSRSFLKQVSQAAAWMMAENVSENHYWLPGVLTDANKTKTRRPIFDQQAAEKIFDELISRKLLVDHGLPADAAGRKAYYMKYDVEGWDKAVTDGRPIIGACKKINRDWPMYLLTLVLGWLLSALGSKFVEMIEAVK